MAQPKNIPRKLRVIVADDNDAVAKTLGWMIEINGHEVRVVNSGEGVLAAAGAMTPDVIFLDISLPGMNGYDVCKLLRADPALTHTVIIAQTGWGGSEHRERAMEAGFNYHLVKPVKINVIEELLSSL